LDYQTYLSKIWFKFLQPDAVRGSDGRFSVKRGDRPPARLLELPYAPVDVANTVLPNPEPVTRALQELCDLPRMSTVSIAAMINEAVARMLPGQAFVNVGLWRGFTFLSGMACNEDKACVGIDDFSWFEGPEEESFRHEFEARRSSNHAFHAMDYKEYFAEVHDRPIGLYCYDADHSYKNQWRGLEIAEPFFAEGCLVLIDDPNWAQVRRATMEFIAASRREYRILMDEGTTDPEHPTLWNGVLMLQVGGERDPAERVEPPSQTGPPPQAPPLPKADSDAAAARRKRQVAIGEPLVSLIVHADRDDADGLAATIETALSQTWPAVEVLVAAEDSNRAKSEAALSAFEGRVQVVRAQGNGRTPALGAALAASAGDFVSVVGAGTRLRERAVHMGLGLPGFRRAVVWIGEDWYEQLGRLLAATEEIRTVVPPDSSVIVIDEKAGRPRTIGKVLEYPIGGGHPVDDDHAIRDLESLRERGAGFIVFLWPGFWWLEHYAGLARHLRTSYRYVLENDRAIVIDLR
jgi:methyltransferase family protein/glycosyl transferase family 2